MKTGQEPTFQTYSHARTLYMPDTDPDEVRDRLAGALVQTGFVIITDIDLGEVLQRTLGAPPSQHHLVLVCHPELTRRALLVASDASLFLPGRIGVWREGSGATVGILPPLRLVEALGRAQLGGIAAEVERRLEDVLSLLAHTDPRTAPTSISTAASLALDPNERTALVEALGQRRQALMVEAAGTEKHSLQHALAQNIEQLDALIGRIDRPRLQA
jgi:uncharacterized protein (DUF302 family)